MRVIPINAGLQLVALSLKDAETLLQVVSDNKWHLRNWLPWVDDFTTIDVSQMYIRKALQQITEKKGMNYAIISNQQLIGEVCAFDFQSDIKCVEIGFWIDKQHSNRGIMTHVLHAFINYLVTQQQVHKVTATIHIHNAASARLLEKLGFKVEGIIRDSVFMNGRYENKAILGLLESEFLVSEI